MPASFPAANTNGDDRFPNVEIDIRRLRIGDTVFDLGNHEPAYVVKNGIEIMPGGAHNFNRVSITFIVGQIDVTDDALEQIRVTPNACQP